MKSHRMTHAHKMHVRTAETWWRPWRPVNIIVPMFILILYCWYLSCDQWQKLREVLKEPHVWVLPLHGSLSSFQNKKAKIVAFQKECQDEFWRSYPNLKAGIYDFPCNWHNVILTAKDLIERPKSQHKLLKMEDYSREGKEQWERTRERTMKAELQGYFINTNYIKEVKATRGKVERSKSLETTEVMPRKGLS